MTDDPFGVFREAVHGDTALQETLAAERDPHAFVALAVRLAAERGITLTPDDVERALLDGRRAWLQRWIA